MQAERPSRKASASRPGAQHEALERRPSPRWRFRVRAALDQSHAEIEDRARRSRPRGACRGQEDRAAALAALPAGDVEIALREAMHQAIGEPRITLRAAPDVVAALESRAWPASPMRKAMTAA